MQFAGMNRAQCPQCGGEKCITYSCVFPYVVYPLVLAVSSHYQGKGETVALERNNGQHRHWTAALRRRSIVVSKSLAMIERRVALFAHLHVNKEAAPEMYRLPIQAGRVRAFG